MNDLGSHTYRESNYTNINFTDYFVIIFAEWGKSVP